MERANAENTVNLVSYCRQQLEPYLRARYGGGEGAALVEYALLVAFIAILCIAAVAFLGTSLANKFSSAGSGVTP
jgi:pilus assembly protein Flp/PilA